MTLKKIFVRFLKDNGLFKNKGSLTALFAVEHYCVSYMPFNEFVWTETEQGHGYWYEMSVKWLIYLFNRYNDLDESEIRQYNLSQKSIVQKIAEVITDYHLSDDGEANRIKWYSDCEVDLYEKVQKRISHFFD